MTTIRPVYLMSVDVEDWFQVENLHSIISRDSWDSRELRVHHSVDIVLDILERSGTKATFFVLGWIANKAPELVRNIHASGHEIACHGYGHALIYNLSREEFRKDVTRAKNLLEDIIGERVDGYRAPSFSITDWAFDILADMGFRYDSSHFPITFHDRYGRLGSLQPSPPDREGDGNEIAEVPLSCLNIAGKNLPWAGGGYFRIIPYPLFKAGVRRIAARERAFCFYIHPWEFDAGQPRVRTERLLHSMRHYMNLSGTAKKYVRLVTDFPFTPMRQAPALGLTSIRP